MRHVADAPAGRSSASNKAPATAATSASSAKNPAWLMRDHNAPTAPAARLPLKVAKNQAASVVAPRAGRREPREQAQARRQDVQFAER